MSKKAIIGILFSVISILTLSVIFSNRSQASNKGVDTTGMLSYLVTIPFKYQANLDRLYEAMKSVNYSYIGNRVISDSNKNPVSIELEIKALPADFDRMRLALEDFSNEIKIKQKQ